MVIIIIPFRRRVVIPHPGASGRRERGSGNARNE